METKDLMKLSVENKGLEKWEIDHAVLAVFEPEEEEEDDEDSHIPQTHELVLELRMGNARKRVPELEEVMRGKPHLQITVFFLPETQPLVSGLVLVQKSGYDHRREMYLSNFYYFNHHSIENVRLEILEVYPGGLRVRITGETVVSNYGKGTPDATLEAEVTAVFGKLHYPR